MQILHVLPALGRSLSQEGIIAVASSVIFTSFFSTIFFLIGCVCGHFHQKQKKTLESDAPTLAVTSHYGNLQPQFNEQELELKENVAYSPVQRHR